MGMTARNIFHYFKRQIQMTSKILNFVSKMCLRKGINLKALTEWKKRKRWARSHEWRMMRFGVRFQRKKKKEFKHVTSFNSWKITTLGSLSLSLSSEWKRKRNGRNDKMWHPPPSPPLVIIIKRRKEWGEERGKRETTEKRDIIFCYHLSRCSLQAAENY